MRRAERRSPKVIGVANCGGLYRTGLAASTPCSRAGLPGRRHDRVPVDPGRSRIIHGLGASDSVALCLRIYWPRASSFPSSRPIGACRHCCSAAAGAWRSEDGSPASSTIISATMRRLSLPGSWPIFPRWHCDANRWGWHKRNQCAEAAAARVLAGRERAAQNCSTAATIAALVSDRRSTVPNSSSSCRLTIDPASSSTAGILVCRSTMS